MIIDLLPWTILLGIAAFYGSILLAYRRGHGSGRLRELMLGIKEEIEMLIGIAITALIAWFLLVPHRALPDLQRIRFTLQDIADHGGRRRHQNRRPCPREGPWCGGWGEGHLAGPDSNASREPLIGSRFFSFFGWLLRRCAFGALFGKTQRRSQCAIGFYYSAF